MRTATSCCVSHWTRGDFGADNKSSARSSRPHHHFKTTSGAQVAVVLALRQMRLPAFQIAKYSDLSRATVSRNLTRHGLAKLSDLDPPLALDGGNQ